MATVLNLFPARIRFVNDDGTLTPEAFRALQILLARVGGPLGDNGVDVFGDLTGAASLDASITDTVIQSEQVPVYFGSVIQPEQVHCSFEMVIQPVQAIEQAVELPAGTFDYGSITVAADVFEDYGAL